MMDKAIKIDDSDSFQTIFTKYGAMALDKQESLSQLIGDNEGQLHVDKGIISFNELEFPIQIIGTLARETEKWHWAWDNDNVNFPEDLIKEAIEIKKIGEKFNISQFTTNIFNADLTEAHIIAMTASEILNEDAYYVVDLDEVLIFVTIKSDKIQKDDSIERFVNTFNKFQKEFDIKPKLAFECYTELKGYEYKEREDFSVAKIGQSRVIVGFSEKGNVNLIQTMLE